MLIYIIIGIIVGTCIIAFLTFLITKSSIKYNNEYLSKQVDELNQKIEDMNAGRIKIPINYGYYTYFVYKDATMEEVINKIGKPTFIDYNYFGTGVDKMSWYYHCTGFDNPTNDRLIIFFKDGYISEIKN